MRARPVANAQLTVAELAACAERFRIALAEGNRPDLAAQARIAVDPTGALALTFAPTEGAGRSPAVLQAARLEPRFKGLFEGDEAVEEDWP